MASRPSPRACRPDYTPALLMSDMASAFIEAVKGALISDIAIEGEDERIRSLLSGICGSEGAAALLLMSRISCGLAAFEVGRPPVISVIPTGEDEAEAALELELKSGPGFSSLRRDR